MEWRKVYRKKKIMGVLLALFCFQIFYFIYSAHYSGTDSSPEEYSASVSSYIQNFHSSVEAVTQQADSMGGISIFSEKDSFSQRNREKTKKDFEPLLSVTPVLIDGEFLTEFFSCSVLNKIAAICGIIIAFVLVDENKRGLRSMIFSATGGRGKLILEKFGALVFWNLVIVLLFYGSVFLESLLIYKGNLRECLSVPIQSLPLFQSLPWKINVGGFLGVYFLYRFVLLLFISLLVWTIVFLVENLALAGGAIGIVGVLSFVLHQVIGSNHPLNVLHYCNLWYQIEGISFFTEYKNLNLASHAVNKTVLIGLVFAICFIGCLLIAFCVGSRRYPCRSQLGQIRRKMLSFVQKVQSIKGFVQEKIPFWAVESYKIIISQKGILILFFLLFLFLRQTDFTSVQRAGRQEMYYDFMDNYLGEPTEDSKNSIEALQQELAEVKRKYLDKQEAYEKGLLSEDEFMFAAYEYETYQSERQFLEMIQEQTSYLEELKRSRGIEGWYINSYSYNHLFEEGASLQTVILMLGAALLCSSIFAQEQKSGMVTVLKSSPNGRGRLFRQKTTTAVSLALLLLLIKEGLHIYSVSVVYGLKGLAAPVQSYYALSFFSFTCSIGAFLAMVYLAKILMMAVLVLFICMCSVYINQKAAIGAVFLFCIPEMLSVIGFTGFWYLSPLNILSVVPFLLEVENFMIIVCVLGFFGVIGAGCGVAGYRKWCVVSYVGGSGNK